MEVKELLFGDILRENLQRNPDSIAISEIDKSITYKELNDKVNALAISMSKMGIKKGTHVVLWSMNNISWLITFFAIQKLGAIACLMNYGLKQADTCALTTLVDGEFLFFGKVPAMATDKEIAYKIADEVKIDKNKVIYIDEVIQNLDKETKANEEINQLDKLEKELNPHDTSVIIYTSGTSSTPKAVMLSAYSIINTERALNEIVKNIPYDKLCLAIPLFHSYGLMMGLTYIHTGKGICLLEIFKPDNLVQFIDKLNCNVLASVGAVFTGIINHPDFKTIISNKIHFCCIGGGTSAPAQLIAFESAFEKTFFLNGYGQTEASPLISAPLSGDPIKVRSETVGKAIPGIEVKIQDSKGNFLEPDSIGEIVVKGYNLMNGYYKLPKEKQAIDENGWLHTGDLGMFDKYGNLRLQGRNKDIIIRGGENISPTEIEAAMMELDYFDSVKVLSAPHYTLGESVIACVIYKQGVNVNETQIKEALKDKLSSYKIPEYILKYKSFPLNENGKIDQRNLRVDELELVYNRRIIDIAKNGLTCLKINVVNDKLYIDSTVKYIQTVLENIGSSPDLVKRIGEATNYLMNKRAAASHDEEDMVNIHLLFKNFNIVLEYTEEGISNALVSKDPITENDKELSQFADRIIIQETKNKGSIFTMEFNIKNKFNFDKTLSTKSQYRDWKENV